MITFELFLIPYKLKVKRVEFDFSSADENPARKTGRISLLTVETESWQRFPVIAMMP